MASNAELFVWAQPLPKEQLRELPIEDEIAHYLWHAGAARDAGKDYRPASEICRHDAQAVLAIVRERALSMVQRGPFLEHEQWDR